MTVLQGAPDEVRDETREASHPSLAAPPRHRPGLVVAAIVGFVIVSIGFVIVLGLFLRWLGLGTTLVGALLALVPLGIVLLGVWWIDRWEPEPRGALAFGFLWGAGAAVGIALVVGSGFDRIAAAAGLQSSTADVVSSVIEAPIVEETAKGLGVLLIFLVARRLFDGPVDGIVYAAVIAGGFAFTENIEYFGVGLSGGDGVAETFFIRGILSPFAHVMFTSLTGLAIGYGAMKGGRARGVGFFFIGLVPAILLHAFWNAALFFVYDFYGYYLLVQVPLFLLGVGIVTMLHRREIRITQTRLLEYASVGWLNPAEVASLATPTGRRHARAWAKAHGVSAAMSAYIADATHLAFARERIVADHDRAAAQAEESVLLARITASRRAIAAGPVAPGLATG